MMTTTTTTTNQNQNQHESWSGRITSILIDGCVSFILMRADGIGYLNDLER